MKVLKAGLVPLFVMAVFLAGALAADYGRGIQPQPSMPGQTMPSQPRMEKQAPGAQSGQVEVFKGTLSSIDPARQEILVRTEVPGILGPQTRDVPFKIDQDTTMTICFKSLNKCESTASGQEGWAMLSGLEKLSSFSSVQRNVIVVGEPVTGRIVHVEIEYNV